MKAEIGIEGTLVITPQNSCEAYALHHWLKNANGSVQTSIVQIQKYEADPVPRSFMGEATVATRIVGLDEPKE